MNDKLKELLDERMDIAAYIRIGMEKRLNESEEVKDLTKIITTEEITSISQTIINNLGKDLRTDIITKSEGNMKHTKEEILTELDRLQHGEVSYPIEVEDKDSLIIVKKTVRDMDRDLWDAVNKKVKELGGHWHKPEYCWQIKVNA